MNSAHDSELNAKVKAEIHQKFTCFVLDSSTTLYLHKQELMEPK